MVRRTLAKLRDQAQIFSRMALSTRASAFTTRTYQRCLRRNLRTASIGASIARGQPAVAEAASVRERVTRLLANNSAAAYRVICFTASRACGHQQIISLCSRLLSRYAGYYFLAFAALRIFAQHIAAHSAYITPSRAVFTPRTRAQYARHAAGGDMDLANIKRAGALA